MIVRVPFTEKFNDISPRSRLYYSDLKNLLLSFGLEAKMTFKNEEFTKDGEIVAKLSISGKIVRLHLALDPNDPTLPFERYTQFSLAEKPSYKDVPFTVKIRSELLFRRCKELIRIVAEIKKLTKNESYQKQDLHLPDIGYHSKLQNFPIFYKVSDRLFYTQNIYLKHSENQQVAFFLQ